MARPSGSFSKLKYKIIKLENGCWILPYKTENNGYYRVRLGTIRILAHRAFYEFYKGAIPENYVIDHLCRNRKCINPDHLEAVTYSVNNLRGAKFRGIYIEHRKKEKR